MKLNLELTEKQMKGMIPQAEKPKDTVAKAPWTKGVKFDPKAPKAKTASLKQPTYKKDLKFAKKGSPLKTGTVQPGKTPSAPSSKSIGFKQPFVSKQKEVGKPPAPKMYKSKAAVPDAMDVTKRGLTNASAGDPVAKFSNAVKKAIEPSKSSKNVTIAKAKIVKPSLGYGVLKPGKVMDTLGNMDMSMNSVPKPPAPKMYSGKSPSISFKESVQTSGFSESVFNGSVEIHVAGRIKSVMEAATVAAVAKKAIDYASIGAKVEIVPVARGRTVYDDQEFAALMVEAEHARHHGLPSKKIRLSAMRRAYDLLASERDPRVHTRDTWLRECLGGFMKQATREFRAAYANALSPYDVTVVTESKRYKKHAMAADERHAAAFAIDSVLAEDIEASIRGVFVGAKKYLPESKGKSMFMRFPEPFKELSTALKIKKSPMGKTASMPIPKVSEFKIGGKSAKGAGSLSIKSNAHFQGTSERSNLVDRNGSKHKMGKPLSMKPPAKDKGPVYEGTVEDAAGWLANTTGRPATLKARNELDRAAASSGHTVGYIYEHAMLGLLVAFVWEEGQPDPKTIMVTYELPEAKGNSSTVAGQTWKGVRTGLGAYSTGVWKIWTDPGLSKSHKIPTPAVDANLGIPKSHWDPALVMHAFNAKRKAEGKSTANLMQVTRPTPTNGINEERMVEDASQRVIDLIDQAVRMSSGSMKKAFKELSEKVKADEDLSKSEMKALDQFIGIALKK